MPSVIASYSIKDIVRASIKKRIFGMQVSVIIHPMLVREEKESVVVVGCKRTWLLLDVCG
jgi:hypothetical protein